MYALLVPAINLSRTKPVQYAIHFPSGENRGEYPYLLTSLGVPPNADIM